MLADRDNTEPTGAAQSLEVDDDRVCDSQTEHNRKLASRAALRTNSWLKFTHGAKKTFPAITIISRSTRSQEH